MKIIEYIVLIAAGILVYYNLQSVQPNLYITIVGIVVFMFILMRISSKIPTKSNNENQDEV